MTTGPLQPPEDNLIPFPRPASTQQPAPSAELTPAPPMLDGELLSEEARRSPAVYRAEELTGRWRGWWCWHAQ